MPSKLRVGVVGANIHEWWGARVHVPVYQALPETEVVAVCNSRLETAQEACQHFGIPQAFNDYNQLAQSPEIDAVSISTRVSLHHPIAMAALSAGKHVFCEWPLAVASDQASEMLSLAQANRLQHGITLKLGVPLRCCE
jgi:predicted dehydrogenase